MDILSIKKKLKIVKEICLQSKVAEPLEPGDVVLADKGFFDKKELLTFCQ